MTGQSTRPSTDQPATPCLAGQRKHIVLVHGGWSWYKVAARLQQRRRGCYGGYYYRVPTFRDYTEPLLDALRSLPDGKRAVLVGHSLGGLSVALAAELLPEKVAAAVFLADFIPDCASPPSHVLQKSNYRPSKKGDGGAWRVAVCIGCSIFYGQDRCVQND
ncbi:hypothetical protein E2562_017555 [Oryza meyeriana var. granulata]|uniref:AB hydrolase-1 domain-containing protein n=1 Tax=Oryza meyeriana var. granulata TaxID=110450 RepID=A0A6G1C797_9ORYZ|nr:hypothetical protein E2562_017555 [Oryza meyeriana var. granulata]